jgi:hypothetical protein
VIVGSCYTDKKSNLNFLSVNTGNFLVLGAGDIGTSQLVQIAET